MNEPYRFPIWLPLTALSFAAAHLTFEHLTGGVQQHNLLNRPDLPAISNWFDLLTLPLLGVVLGLRVRNLASTKRWAGVPVSVLVALLGALAYGAAMAASFELGVKNVTSAAFLGLFVCGLVFPVYRAEYLLGFVTGMTFAFGGVLPMVVGLVIAALSFVVRLIGTKLIRLMR